MIKGCSVPQEDPLLKSLTASIPATYSLTSPCWESLASQSQTRCLWSSIRAENLILTILSVQRASFAAILEELINSVSLIKGSKMQPMNFQTRGKVISWQTLMEISSTAQLINFTTPIKLSSPARHTNSQRTSSNPSTSNSCQPTSGMKTHP